jgi:hypothetical protein
MIAIIIIAIIKVASLFTPQTFPIITEKFVTTIVLRTSHFKHFERFRVFRGCPKMKKGPSAPFLSDCSLNLIGRIPNRKMFSHQKLVTVFSDSLNVTPVLGGCWYLSKALSDRFRILLFLRTTLDAPELPISTTPPQF